MEEYVLSNFSPDGKYAVTNSIQDSDVILWDIEKGVEARRFRGLKAYLAGIFATNGLFSPDGKQAFIYGLPSKTFDIKTGEGLIDFPRAWQGKRDVTSPGRNMGWAQVSSCGRYILLNSNDAAVRIYDAKTGQEVAILIGFKDGEWLAITSEGYYNASEKGAQYLTVKMGDKDYMVESFMMSSTART